MSRTGKLSLVLVLLAALAAACGDDTASDQGGNGLEKSTINVAMLALVVNAPYYIAVQEKLFEAEGLTVRTQPVQQSTQAYPALKTGDVDVVFANNASMLLGHDKGDLRINLVAEGSRLTPKFMGVLVMPDSPITDMKGLEGRSLSVHVLNNIQAITFDAIAAAGGVDPAKLRYRQVVFPQMAATMQKGDLDAIHTQEPFLTDTIRKLGARMVADGGAVPATDLPLDGYFSLDTWTRQNPRTAAAFQRAIQKASLIAADRARVEAILPTYARGIDPAVAKAMTMPAFGTSASAERMQQLIDLMVEQKRLTNKIDAGTIVFQPS
ncbi:ABC transporter substrate-binding protein [Actinoplanes aureus]|uniref:ABC transporter substrate-binding protein n=1 Tax=Actinoplanes aureus TaxID=2792083 RepID=A0A931CJ41_9ACTN|nr:ABC transporter substrate-binding protein [Actinoplanes aureus]MBG0567123.1 ABC transporter substrate-binding protein [Actinoplanes aureus]